MAVILNTKKSTYGSPYAWYKLETVTISNRTADTVDITFKSTSRLDNAGSSLGRNYDLTAGVYIKSKWYNYKIKDNESWSGTTLHTKNQTFTITGLNPAETELTGIKYRVVSSASDNASGLNATACYNIPVPLFHNPPVISAYEIEETNQDLIDAGVSDDVFVANLSQKEIDITYTLEEANFQDATVYNGLTNVYDSNSLPITMDLTTNALRVDESGVPIVVSVTDDLNTRGYFSNTSGAVLSNPIFDYYSYIPYTKPSFTATTNAKRQGQISGQVALNIEGAYFNGVIGNKDQTSYKPTLKYKYWKYGETEPDSYNDTIPSTDITINNGTFSVSGYEIGSTTETDSNYFDPEYAWRIKLYVEDYFANNESNELQIQVGEATWTEYKDRVDFKKLTVRGNEILSSYVLYEDVEGSIGTITLADTSANYKYIEIYYIYQGSPTWGVSSKKVFEPNGKSVLLDFMVDNNNYFYANRELANISGNQLTRSGGYRWRFATSGNPTRTAVNNMSIVRVVGYK